MNRMTKINEISNLLERLENVIGEGHTINEFSIAEGKLKLTIDLNVSNDTYYLDAILKKENKPIKKKAKEKLADGE